MPNNWSLNDGSTWHNNNEENTSAQFYSQELIEFQRRIISEIERLCSIHNVRFSIDQIEILVNNEFINLLKSRVQNQSSLINSLHNYKSGALLELEKILNSRELSTIQMAIETKKVLDANLKLGAKSKEMLKKEENKKNVFDDIFNQFYKKIVTQLGANDSFSQDIFYCFKNLRTMLEDDFHSKKSSEIMNIFVSVNNAIKNNLSTIKEIEQMQIQNSNSRGSRGFVNIFSMSLFLLLVCISSIIIGYIILNK